ncbi:nicotinamide-nucleotide amidohydrolase family protein [Roseomonas sp. NAR14]|uniref:Nicotinamide-nucleotide amidohydrolase family protein n=1 Tax=Roseomonas acroporae TaxID=2937791 RepID=A0A9X1Y7L6_9PROT|nr:nicotinamide-nucleotide amidohydrolase family protein [Roseomonas acroporae]MCK8783557.1 nicotinamide-nucleotide amidohydrolase family protein [Roseomonas acroporae]
MLPDTTLEQARALLELLRERGMTIATAESCTGGLIAAALTAIPGSSDSVVGGFVTYSNQAKVSMLGVPPGVLAGVGAVSEAVARRMAESAAGRGGADIGVSCTGIAGPGGATETKPVGLVFIGAARRGGTALVERHVLPGDRAAVRAATVAAALSLVEAMLREG